MAGKSIDCAIYRRGGAYVSIAPPRRQLSLRLPAPAGRSPARVSAGSSSSGQPTAAAGPSRPPPTGSCGSPLTTARAAAMPVDMATRTASSSSAEAPSAQQPRPNPLDDDVDYVMYGAEEIQIRVAEIADSISSDLAGHDDVLVLGVLTGAFMFTSDLVKHLSISAEVRFCRASSYQGTETTGKVTVSGTDLKAEDVRGKTVLLVEDIIDTGNTLNKLVGMVTAMEPKEVRIVCLLDKPDRRTVDVAVDYTAFTVPDKFVIGYGLDFNEKYRCLPYIGVLKPELYAHL